MAEERVTQRPFTSLKYSNMLTLDAKSWVVVHRQLGIQVVESTVTQPVLNGITLTTIEAPLDNVAPSA